MRKLFAAYDIPYRSIDLDSVDYQKDGLGGEIRAALLATTGKATIPQIYVGGLHIGGATEFFDALINGDMRSIFDDAGVSWNASVETDPYSFMPGWLHKRQLQ